MHSTAVEHVSTSRHGARDILFGVDRASPVSSSEFSEMKNYEICILYFMNKTMLIPTLHRDFIVTIHCCRLLPSPKTTVRSASGERDLKETEQMTHRQS